MDPEPGVSRGFNFPAVGGAVLLSADPSRPGFTAFRFATFPEFADLFQGYVEWQDDAGPEPAHHGRNILTVEIAESYTVRALECAESTVRELATAQGLDLGAVDLLVATASVPGFADALAMRLGVSAERVASLPDDLAHAHTAAPAIALVGSAEDIAGAIMEYRQVGITQFLFMGWPDLQEMTFFSQTVMPLVRAMEASSVQSASQSLPGSQPDEDYR
jgi:hypothetical protein